MTMKNRQTSKKTLNDNTLLVHGPGGGGLVGNPQNIQNSISPKRVIRPTNCNQFIHDLKKRPVLQAGKQKMDGQKVFKKANFNKTTLFDQIAKNNDKKLVSLGHSRGLSNTKSLHNLHDSKSTIWGTNTIKMKHL
jgi:hypothetical protein